MSHNTLTGVSLSEVSPKKPGYTALPVVYAIHGVGTMSEVERQKLCSVLGIKITSLSDDGKLYIAPRPGMKTPSSSKIAGALISCGINVNIQVEKINQYELPEGIKTSDAIKDLVDRMQQVMLSSLDNVDTIFLHGEPGSIKRADILNGGVEALRAFNTSEKFGLNNDQIDYLYKIFSAYDRNPTDLELMCFAQANSEHCRHGTFNAFWTIDGVKQ